MSSTKLPEDFFKRMVRQREENSRALEERTKGEFTSRRFYPPDVNKPESSAGEGANEGDSKSPK